LRDSYAHHRACSVTTSAIALHVVYIYAIEVGAFDVVVHGDGQVVLGEWDRDILDGKLLAQPEVVATRKVGLG